MDDILSNCIGFEWDSGNIDKNLEKHGVHFTECEQIFFKRSLLISEDIKHSEAENRYYGLGTTVSNRKLFISITVRNRRIRIISARDMSKNERRIYETKQEEDTRF